MIDTPFNILLLGNSNVGKSTIMERYLQNKFVDIPKTVSIEKRDTLLDLQSRTITAKIIDAPGSNRTMIQQEYKTAKAVILIYDITDQQSFLDIYGWYNEFQHANDKVDYWVVVGNKTDLIEKRKVSKEDGKKFATHIGARFIESSAKQPSNINLIFITIQQWNQMGIVPKLVGEPTQKLLQKLQHEEVQSKSLETSKIHGKRRNNNDISLFEEQPNENMQDYFNQQMKFLSPNDVKLADDLIQESLKKQFQHLKINENKTTILDEQGNKQDGHFKKKLMEKKLIQLDKLRKEISQHLYLVQEQKRCLRVDQLKEHTQQSIIEREFTQRLKSVEKNMELLKTDLILSTKTHRFSSNQQKFVNLDESLIMKQQISSIYDPEHFKEQQESIVKIIQERKKLENKRNERYQKYLEQIAIDEKTENEKKQQEIQLKLQQKKEKLKEKQISMERIRKEREEINTKQNEHLKQLINSQPLHLKLETTFKEQLMQKQMEDQQLKLKQVKETHQPVRLPEIKEWEDKYIKVKKANDDLRQEKVQERNKINYQASFVSNVYQEAKQEQIDKLKEHERILLEQQRKQQILQEYTTKLKGQLPTISQEKHLELEEQTLKLHHRPNFQEYVSIAKRVKQKGVFFDKQGKLLERSIDEGYYIKLMEQDTQKEDIKDLGQRYLDESKKILKKPASQQAINQAINQSMSTQSNPDLIRNIKHNKLQEIKKQWKLKPRQDLQGDDLENILHNENLYGFNQKALMEDANRLASQALKKMEITAAKGNNQESIKEMENADKLLINTIKAKLSIMEHETEIQRNSQRSIKKRGRSITKQTN